ncbi:MAG TPA: hypothetical protein VMV27_02105 [Candidatus Binataceae bacterium]|nr:hypothetical protein [Candidatus Binataceae bacterium]
MVAVIFPLAHKLEALELLFFREQCEVFGDARSELVASDTSLQRRGEAQKLFKLIYPPKAFAENIRDRLGLFLPALDSRDLRTFADARDRLCDLHRRMFRAREVGDHGREELIFRLDHLARDPRDHRRHFRDSARKPSPLAVNQLEEVLASGTGQSAHRNRHLLADSLDAAREVIQSGLVEILARLAGERPNPFAVNFYYLSQLLHRRSHLI